MSKIDWKQIEKQLPDEGTQLEGILSSTGSFSLDLNENQDIFLIKDNNKDLLRVNKQGVLQIGELTEPQPAVEGGIIYRGSNFWIGID